ncbi:hypothetical protein JCM3766R1_003605 [Sporobolomyces carnicolor]
MTVSLNPAKTTKIPPYLPDRNNYQPTHPGLVHVEFGKEGEEFNSCLKTDKAFKAGETICTICNTLSGEKAYSSVQVLPDPPLPASFAPSSASLPQTYYSQSPQPRRHIELNSDLLYVNHSCDPNVVFDVNGREAEKGENDESGAWEGRWRVRAIKDIAQGEILTFAYFSTEWDMDQPFSCLCNTSKCLGTIRGAKDIPAETLNRYFVGDHIQAMKALQASTTKSSAKLPTGATIPPTHSSETRSPQAVKA